MKKQHFEKVLSLLLCLTMLMGLIPIGVYAEDYEEPTALPVPVTTENKTYRLFTEENLEEQFGTSFLYVVKSGDRYYTPAHPNVSSGSFDSVPAIDITEYWDGKTQSFSNIPDSIKVGVMQYQTYPFPSNWGGSALWLDGNIMFRLSVPFESEGETWFENGLWYHDREDTYSYSRALWHANGDGSGYLYDSYIDWIGDSDTWVYGVLSLRIGSLGEMRFSLRNMSEEYNNEEAIDVGAYLFAAPCGHAATEHSAYDAPTCMDKGCDEYWYCPYCNSYFSDEACTEEYESKPILPALDHNYGETACTLCQKPIPKYTKITSYEQFKTLDENASFIAVAEIDDGNGGKEYYVLKKPVNIVTTDVDENGVPDILLVDENNNGMSDILETDADGDGTPDALACDGCWGEETLDGVLDEFEIEQYLFELELQYTDGYMIGARKLDAVKVTPENGSISVKDLDALEFIMERHIPDEALEEQYYGDGVAVKDYENDFRFRIPNFWVRPMVTIDNNYYQQGYEQGDSKVWGVLFGKDVKELDDWRAELFAQYPDDAAILYTETFHSRNVEGEVEHGLRFLVNGENKNFLITSNSFWEEIEGTQIPIYLYCSDAGDEIHTHVFGPWKSVSDEIHKRVCTVEGCNELEIAAHNKDEAKGCEPDPDNVEAGHWVTCTDCKERYHEYHTHKVVGYKDYCEDSEDGETHVVSCTVCNGPAAYEKHKWTDWWREELATGEIRHVRRCSTYACYRYEYSDDHIYKETVTKAATCTEKGEITYTCTADYCTYSYTQQLPALDHDWGEWTLSQDDPTKETRICKNDPSHVEERDADLHEHQWSDWTKTDERLHTRTCSAEGCTIVTETAEHVWDEGKETKPADCTTPGEITYTCSDCKAVRTETTDPLDHDWSDWTEDTDTDTHSRTCSRGCGVEKETGRHEWSDWTDSDGENHLRSCTVCRKTEHQSHAFDNGTVINWATHLAPGEIQFTCTDCGFIKSEEQPILPEHEWGEWTADSNGATHTRTCICQAEETLPHQWSSWTHVEAGRHKRECADCGAREWMTLDEEHPVNIPNPENAANTNLINSDVELIQNVLTNEEQSQIAAGAEVKIYLKVEDISENVSTAEKTKAEEAAGTNEIGMYLDIDLFKQIGDNEEEKVTETGGTVTITITIPAELINTDEAVNRTYKIIRVHEDAAGNLITDVIEGVFNPEDNSFTFETNRFSTYALTYEDKAPYVPGDVDGSGLVDSADAIHLLYHTLLGEGRYPIAGDQPVDYNNDGKVDSADAIYLLYHTLLGAERYPLS